MILFWNVRGVNSLAKQKRLREKIKLSRVSVVCLFETHVIKEKQKKVIDYIFPNCSFVDNFDHVRLGRIWILYSNEIRLHVHSSSSQSINCHIYSEKIRKYFFLSAIYASNDEIDRRILWSEMRNLKSLVSSAPWLAVGDFNVVLQMNECSEFYDGLAAPSKVQDFHSCINDTELIDIPQSGPIFTWTNKRIDGFLARKLDRAMANSKWLEDYAGFDVAFHPPEFSDHCAGLIAMQTATPTKHRPFKFFNYLIKHRDFLPEVSRTWSTTSVYGTKMYQLSKKIKALKPVLRALSRDNYQSIQQRVVEARRDLLATQSALLLAPTSNLILHERELSQTLKDLEEAEESYLQQKSRIHWLQAGDQNTSFFHKVVQGRQTRNVIKSLTVANGSILTDSNDIKAEFLCYYENLLGTAAPPRSDISQVLSSLISSTLPSDFHEMLTSEVTAEEILGVVKGMPKNKSPGPDGFTSEFFQATWDITGDLVICDDPCPREETRVIKN